MKSLSKTVSLSIGLSLLFSFQQINAQFKPLSTTGRMIESNVPVLDSTEKIVYPKMVKLEDETSIENPSKRKPKPKVEVRLFQETNALKFQLYVDNKYKQKVIIRVLDRGSIQIFEDVPYEGEKFQRLYDLSFLAEKEEYYFSAFYENQDHYFFPINIDTEETKAQVAKLSTEYPLELGKGKN
jgi:hypothetical protein